MSNTARSQNFRKYLYRIKISCIISAMKMKEKPCKALHSLKPTMKGVGMIKHKFTKAPWTVLPEEVDRNYIRIRGTRLGERYKIANVITPVYENVHPREAEETRANATLIATAPELLEALEALLVFDNGDAAFHKARLIALKATGVKID